MEYKGIGLLGKIEDGGLEIDLDTDFDRKDVDSFQMEAQRYVKLFIVLFVKFVQDAVVHK